MTDDHLISALRALCGRFSKDPLDGRYEVANKAGLSEQYLYQILANKPMANGERRSVGKIARGKLTRAFPNWLEQAQPTEDKYIHIPRLSLQVAAGNGVEPEHVEVQSTLAFQRQWLAKKGLNPDHLEVYEASGDSMSPRIENGDVLLVDISATTPRNDEIWVIWQEMPQGIRVKRLLFRETGDIIIRSDHPDKSLYPDEIVTAQNLDTIKTVGKVVWRGG